MPRRYVFRAPADLEYLSLPRTVRIEFEEILPNLVRRPLRSGPGYSISNVRNHPGLWNMKLTRFPPRTFRCVYEVDGDIVRFLGFGPRPDLYRRLEQKDRFSPRRF